jgi:hypothetical protein
MYSNLKFDIKSTVEIEGTGLINWVLFVQHKYGLKQI